MFSVNTYRQRREDLRKRMDAGLILFSGNAESPVNFADNLYPFRQDSCFLYYWGIDRPDLAAVIDIDGGTEILFGDDLDLEARVWTGPVPEMADWGAAAGVEDVRPSGALADAVAKAREAGRAIHIRFLSA